MITDHKILLNGITVEYLNNAVLDGLEERLRTLINESKTDQVKYLTRNEVAEYFSVSLVTIHDWSKKKILNPYRIGNRVYFKSNEIENSLKPINPRNHEN
ncbi:MAG: helix-turn-helix domain-containing protein [Cytophagales bacterium]